MELLGRELGTHWADFGNVEPNPNRTMPESGRRLLSTRLLTRAQWYWSHFDSKATLGRAPLRNGSGGKRPPITDVGRCGFPAELRLLAGPDCPTKIDDKFMRLRGTGSSGWAVAAVAAG